MQKLKAKLDRYALNDAHTRITRRSTRSDRVAKVFCCQNVCHNTHNASHIHTCHTCTCHTCTCHTCTRTACTCSMQLHIHATCSYSVRALLPLSFVSSLMRCSRILLRAKGLGCMYVRSSEIVCNTKEYKEMKQKKEKQEEGKDKRGRGKRLTPEAP